MENGMDGMEGMDPQKMVFATARTALSLAENIAFRLVDILVAKSILTRGEARATLFALADGSRTDANGLSRESVEAAEMVARWLEDNGMRFSPPDPGKIV